MSKASPEGSHCGGLFMVAISTLSTGATLPDATSTTYRATTGREPHLHLGSYRVKAILVPSGDHLGVTAVQQLPGGRTSRWWLPFASMIHMPSPRLKAIFVPSGEYEG